MVVYTKILRNFNIKWFINTEKEGKLFCGASKSIISLTEQEPDSSTVLNSYEVFSKTDVHFATTSTSTL